MSNGPNKTKPYLLLLLSYNDDFAAQFELCKSVATRMGYSIYRTNSAEVPDGPIHSIEDLISGATVVVADLTTIDPDLTMQIGFARGIGKPIVYMTSGIQYVAPAFNTLRLLVYDLTKPAEALRIMEQALREAAERPDLFLQKSQDSERKQREYVFISYSHHDKDYLDRLLIHLKPLEHNRQIDLWADTKIRAGDLWKKEIAQALDRASVAVLLVSADFLASDFIVNNELPPILTNAAEHGTRILPVILKPCRFARDRTLHEFQAINDPDEPLINLSEGDKERYYDLVAREVEKSLVATK